MNCDNESSQKRSKVAYIFNQDLLRWSDLADKVRHRAKLVHGLIEAYGLLKHMRIVNSAIASYEQMLQFHSSNYLQFLQSINNVDDEEQYMEEADQYGLTYDCPTHKGIYDYISHIAGSTIQAARCLTDKNDPCQVAINWFGGWHHAQRDTAAGFCYVNDCVLAILELRKDYDRVLYVDLDLHHGDGVEEAFAATSKVFTVSFHKFSAGFFPGTGKANDIGFGKGLYHCVNVPFIDGLKDLEFVAFFKRVLSEIFRVFVPEVIVCQCGADGIAGDPMNSFNLTPRGLAACVRYLNTFNLPLLLLGGGGYNFQNTARAWTLITAAILEKKLSENIPDHRYYITYGPDYELNVTPGNRKDLNSYKEMRAIYEKVVDNLNCIKLE